MLSCQQHVQAIIRSYVSPSSLPPATVLHVFTDRCSAVSREMSYGLFLLHTCGIKEDKTRASETIEINLIIHCCVLVLQAYADVSIDVTLTLYNRSHSLKPFGGSFICLYFFFSVGCLPATTQRPTTWRTAPWSQALTTSR